MTALENILTAAEIHRSWSPTSKVDARALAEEVLDRVGIRSVANDRVDSMPTGLARLVELGRALATRPRVLLLDEPASGLDETESDAFADLLLDLAARRHGHPHGRARRALVMKVCDVDPRARLRRHPRRRHRRGHPAEPDGPRRLPGAG